MYCFKYLFLSSFALYGAISLFNLDIWACSSALLVRSFVNCACLDKLSICTFQSQEFFDHIPLNVSPKPDTLIRIFLTIKKIDSPIEIKEQKLQHHERKGFTVVEWGGSCFWRI